jgi:hypothetical protein
VERGVKEGVAANYASPAARNLLVQVRQEQEAKAAQAKAE